MKKTLLNLLDIKTQSKTAKFIRRFLNKNNIPFYTDVQGNIFNFDKNGVALLSAHMDTVVEYVPKKQKKSDLKETVLENGNTMLNGNGIIGADDKCGIYLILRILKENEHPINFVFSKDEEIGCLGIQDVLTDKSNAEQIEMNCLYCLVLDRHGNKDICCSGNNYGSIEFEDALVETSIANGFEYRPSDALYSDADFLSEYISTTNLSVGYYNEHTDKEYIILEELEIAYRYIKSILQEVVYRYEPPKFILDNFQYSDWRDYAYDEYPKDDYSDWGDFPAYDGSLSVNDFLEIEDFFSFKKPSEKELS